MDAVNIGRHHCSQSSSLSAAAPGGVSGNGSDILNATNLNAVSGNSPKSRLGARSRCLVSVSASGSELDVDCSDIELLEPVDDVDGRLHSRVGRALVAVCLHLHASSDAGEGLAASEIGDVDEGVVPGGQDVAHCEDVARGVLGTEGSFGLRLCDLLSAFLAFPSLLLLLLGSRLGLSRLDFSHISI